MPTRLGFLLAALLMVCLSLVTVEAQQTAFTYQGKLTDNGSPANGNYDLQIALFDSATGGAQIGSTQTLTSVSVTAGVFTVTLDFGASAFSGANRFLEISTRASGGGAFTLLSPRQQISSTPYAVRSLSSGNADAAANAQQLGGVEANQYVQTNDARMSDSRAPTTGSSNYIQNTTSQQTDSNFSISGNGAAGGTLSGNVLNSMTRYDIGGQRVLDAQASTLNTFLGIGAGASNTTGMRNTVFGHGAGKLGTTASYNSFFGARAGEKNTATGNSFFGVETGLNNTTGSNNVFVGDQAGYSNTTGSNNVSLGDASGFSNTTEDNNTFIGAGANGVPGITNATAIGANTLVSQSNTVVLGNDVNVGIGEPAPLYRLHVIGPHEGLRVETSQPGGILGSFGGYGLFWIDGPGVPGGRFAVIENGNVGIGTSFPNNKLEILDETNTGLRVQNSSPGGTVASFGSKGDFNIDSPGFGGGRFTVRENGRVGIGVTLPTAALHVNGAIRFVLSGGPGTTQLCQNSAGEISLCSSSLRYKTDFRPFTRGLKLIDRLHPLTFKWKIDQSLDLGLGAEDVAAVEPLLVTRNAKGEVEGVKYDRLSVVLINAIKEQQTQIKSQEEKIKSQEVKFKSQSEAFIALQTRLASLERSLRAPRHYSRRKNIRSRKP
jgi:hypothetical protein